MVRVLPLMVFMLTPLPCWSLRKSKLRQMRQEPVTPPAEIFDQVELTNEFHLGEQCTSSDWITDMAGAAVSGKPYGACALIGTGGALAGTPGGPRVDSHDTVIQVGAVPGGADSNGTLVDKPVARVRNLRGPDVYDLSGAGGTEVFHCSHEEACPLGVVVLDAGVADAKRPASSTNPLARQSKTVHRVLKHLESLALHGKQPTPGLRAFFTFLPLCDMITLYGFQNNDAPDDGASLGIHNVTAEWKLLRAVADGQLPSEYLGLRDVPPALRRIEECLLPHFHSNAMMVHVHRDDSDID